jgi:hypothetical protein
MGKQLVKKSKLVGNTSKMSFPYGPNKTKSIENISIPEHSGKVSNFSLRGDAWNISTWGINSTTSHGEISYEEWIRYDIAKLMTHIPSRQFHTNYCFVTVSIQEHGYDKKWYHIEHGKDKHSKYMIVVNRGKTMATPEDLPRMTEFGYANTLTDARRKREMVIKSLNKWLLTHDTINGWEPSIK